MLLSTKNDVPNPAVKTHDDAIQDKQRRGNALTLIQGAWQGYRAGYYKVAPGNCLAVLMRFIIAKNAYLKG